MPAFTNVITGTPIKELTNYTILITVLWANDMQNNFSDVYFTATDGSELDSWLDTKTDGVEAKFWVKIPYIPVSSGTVKFYTRWNDGHAPTRSRSALLVADDIEDGGNMTLLKPYSGNPVIDPSDAGNWTAQHMYFDHLIYHDNKYILYWNGRPDEQSVNLNSIGAATSLDGFSFSCAGINSGDDLGKIFSGTGLDEDWDGGYVNFSCYYVENNTVHMFYLGSNKAQTATGIGHATSADGLTNWQRDANNPVFGSGKRPGGIVKFNDTYFFYYLTSDPGITGMTLHVATAPSLDGPWTDYESNPILTAVDPSMDYGIPIAKPVLWDGKIYLISAIGRDLPADNKFRFILAVSEDGYNFTSLGYPEQAPFWSYDSNNAWENYYINGRPFAIRIQNNPNERMLFYWGADNTVNGKDAIGVAESTYSEMPWLPAGKSGTERITKWADESVNPIIGSHSLKCEGVGAGRDYIFIDVGESDVEVIAKVKSLEALSEHGICLRLTPTTGSENGTGYGLWLDRTTGTFALKKMADASVNILDNAGIPDGEEYELVLRAYNNNIVGFVRNLQGETIAELAANDAAYTSTLIGLGSKGVYQTLFDSIRVRKYVFPEPLINKTPNISVPKSPRPAKLMLNSYLRYQDESGSVYAFNLQPVDQTKHKYRYKRNGVVYGIED